MISAFLAQYLLPMMILVPAPLGPECSDKGFGFLGVSYVDEVVGKSLRVHDVYEDSPAERAGVRTNDLIVGLAGQGVSNTDSFTRTIVRMRPTTVVELNIERDGKPMVLRVKLGVRPDSFPHPFPESQRDPRP